MTVCVILAMFMAAIEVTIVATAMPAIVGQLGNFSLYTWVFSAFLLTQAATIMMFGKLADLYGRRPVLIAGISVFLLGSVLCGLARSMMMLIIFRLIQGLGAGSIQPVAMTIIGDLYTLDERAKIQGYLASVWGVAAIIGPLAGGIHRPGHLVAVDILDQCSDRPDHGRRGVAVPPRECGAPPTTDRLSRFITVRRRSSRVSPSS